MPELWKLCNIRSRVILAYLYKLDNGHYPNWYLILQGGKPSLEPLITMSPDVEESHLAEVNREMSQAPSRSRGKLDELPRDSKMVEAEFGNWITGIFDK